MRAISCDRCGQDTEEMDIIFQGTLLDAEWAEKTGRFRYEWGGDKDIDLCHDCKEDLVELLSDWFTTGRRLKGG